MGSKLGDFLKLPGLVMHANLSFHWTTVKLWVLAYHLQWLELPGVFLVLAAHTELNLAWDKDMEAALMELNPAWDMVMKDQAQWTPVWEVTATPPAWEVWEVWEAWEVTPEMLVDVEDM